MRRQITILIVDDQQKILRFLSAQLKAENYLVLTADSGLEALLIIGETLPDLVVLDILMPGIKPQ